MAVVVAWGASGTPEGAHQLADLVEQTTTEDTQADLDGRLLIGLTTLAGWLARNLAEATGQTPAEVLSDIALTAEQFDQPDE